MSITSSLVRVSGTALALALGSHVMSAQAPPPQALILKGGHVIDARNGIETAVGENGRILTVHGLDGGLPPAADLDAARAVHDLVAGLEKPVALDAAVHLWADAKLVTEAHLEPAGHPAGVHPGVEQLVGAPEEQVERLGRVALLEHRGALDQLDEAPVRRELEGNLCRCTGYHNIVKAIAAGAKAMAKGGARQAAE